MNSAALFLLALSLVSVCYGQGLTPNPDAQVFTDYGAWATAVGATPYNVLNPQDFILSATTTSPDFEIFNGFGYSYQLIGDTLQQSDNVRGCQTGLGVPFSGLQAASDTNLVFFQFNSPYPTAVAFYFAAASTVFCDPNSDVVSTSVFIITNLTSYEFNGGAAANYYEYDTPNAGTAVGPNGLYFFGIIAAPSELIEGVGPVTAVSSGNNYVTLFNITYNQHCVVCGDPHFFGLQGERYDVQGEPNAWFNIITDVDFQFNGFFEEQTCWTAPGTYMTKLGFKISGHELFMDENTPTLDGVAIKTDQSSIPIGANATYGSFRVLEENKFQLVTPDWALELERFSFSDKGKLCLAAGFNVIHLSLKNYHTTAHGLLGQTAHHHHPAHNIQGEEGEGEIEGTYKDYEVSGPYATNFQFNRYAFKA